VRACVRACVLAKAAVRSLLAPCDDAAARPVTQGERVRGHAGGGYHAQGVDRAHPPLCAGRVSERPARSAPACPQLGGVDATAACPRTRAQALHVPRFARCRPRLTAFCARRWQIHCGRRSRLGRCVRVLGGEVWRACAASASAELGWLSVTTPTKRTGVCIRNTLTPALALARAPSLADRNEKDRAQTREDAPGGRLLLAPHGLFYVLRLPPHPRTRNPFAFASPGVSVAYVPACGRGRGRGRGVWGGEGWRACVRACGLRARRGLWGPFCRWPALSETAGVAAKFTHG